MTAKNHHCLDGIDRYFILSSCRFKEVTKNGAA
jgi:hypothetical protein